MRILLKSILAVAIVFISANASLAEDAMVTKKSNYSVSETLDRLGAAVTKGGGKVFARVDHAAGAEAIGSELRATEMILFGNPKLGTPAMQAAQTMGLDLPLRALAWQAEDGSVYLTYHKPASVGKGHDLSGDVPIIQKMTAVLEKLSNHATQ